LIGSLMSIDVIRFTNAVRKAKQSFVQFRARKMGMRELDLNLKDRRPILIGKEYVYMHK